MYKVRVERKAQKKLAKIPEPYYSNIKDAILDLGNDPRPKGCKKLKGRDGYRVRVADYRIIYKIQDSVLLVDVVDLGHRKDIY
ncbi:type II toxin-antitoxin system RelE/ParE family toxin [Aquiflexum sp.]|uniref:type II toxin-antitoxin system RelE family toxin n=1 Tax=Aquiflexum sp. TaxID=1872584 RepID=UPI003593C739